MRNLEEEHSVVVFHFEECSIKLHLLKLTCIVIDLTGKIHFILQNCFIVFFNIYYQANKKFRILNIYQERNWKFKQLKETIKVKYVLSYDLLRYLLFKI